MRDIVTGCSQFAIKPGEVQYNCDTAERMLSELADGNCRLAVLPEMWSCRKVHLFSPYNEQGHFAAGTSAEVFSTSIGKVSMMICYDLRFPELARRLALDGAEIICPSALWPAVRIENWSLLLRARANENQLFMIGCNGCGPPGENHQWRRFGHNLTPGPRYCPGRASSPYSAHSRNGK
jgi:predicted amidohydrolase